MIVSDLIRLPQQCDPHAIVLIPCDMRAEGGAEIASQIALVPNERFSSGPAATHGAVRLMGLPAASLSSLTCLEPASARAD